MQKSIALHTLIATSDDGFSFDEFILRLNEYAMRDGLPGIASFVLSLIDESLLIRQTLGPKEKRMACPHCGGKKFTCKDRAQRTIRTGIGKVNFLWRRLLCSECNRLFIPLRSFTRLERWQSKTNELERTAMEVFTEQSYRRGSNHFKQIGVIHIPHSTAHRWVMETDSAAMDTRHSDVEVVMADGTGFKRRPNKEAGVDNKGEVRVGVGLTRKGKWVPLCAETQESWDELATRMKERVGEDEDAPSMAVSDGERGLPEALAQLAGNVQRCTWHLTHQLRFALYDDKVKKPEQKPHLDELATILAINVPPNSLQPIDPGKRAEIEQQMMDSAAAMDRLIGVLSRAGHSHAATYLRKAQSQSFSWLAFWLQSGICCARTTSYLERLMREIGRRLKKIAFGWKPAGAAQMTRLIIRKIVNPDEWKLYWKERLGIEGNVRVVFRSVGLSIS